ERQGGSYDLSEICKLRLGLVRATKTQQSARDTRNALGLGIELVQIVTRDGLALLLLACGPARLELLIVGAAQQTHVVEDALYGIVDLVRHRGDQAAQTIEPLLLDHGGREQKTA